MSAPTAQARGCLPAIARPLVSPESPSGRPPAGKTTSSASRSLLDPRPTLHFLSDRLAPCFNPRKRNLAVSIKEDTPAALIRDPVQKRPAIRLGVVFEWNHGAVFENTASLFEFLSVPSRPVVPWADAKQLV